MTARFAVGDRVVAFSDYWHEVPYGSGQVIEVVIGNDHVAYYTVRLDRPVPMASPPRDKSAVFTSRVLTLDEAAAQKAKVRDRWGAVKYVDRWGDAAGTGALR
jgi:hypothetical protein